MSEKRKIVVLIDKNALNVEKEIADEAYTWEDYPDAKLRAADKYERWFKVEAEVAGAVFVRLEKADKLCEAAREYLAGGEEFQGNDLDKAIADYEGKQ